MKQAKDLVEKALAEDTDLGPPTKQLEDANLRFKDEIKHANMHVPKPKAKSKAKAKAAAKAPES